MGTADQASDGDDLARARRRVITRRLPAFTAIWLASAAVWLLALRLEGYLGAPAVAGTVLVYAAILLVALAICLADPSAPRVFPTVIVACVLLAVSTTALFVGVRAGGDFLAFLLLMLYLLAALFFTWGWKAELALVVGTAIPWAFTIPLLGFSVPTIELVAAIVVGSVISLTTAEGAARAFVAATRHRTAEEARRRELEASRNAYRDLAEQAHEPIFAADTQGRFTYVNAALAQCLGEAESAIVGRPVGEFLTEHPANRRLRALLTDPEERPPAIEFEVRTVRGPRWFETQPAVVRDESARVSGIQAICRDVTARKQLERERDAVIVREHAARVEAEAARIEAVASAHARDEFLAMLSHELRSPLGSILTWTRMLRRGMVDPARMPHALASIEDAAKAQERMVGDLLDISRIAAGKFSLHLERVDVASVLTARLEATRATAEAKGVALEEHLAPVGPVRGDPTRLGQVFENLISNALKFTPAGGRIEVILEPARGEAQVTVRDTGIGIPPEVLPHVFDEFKQADQSITRRYGGLGLGLAIARRLVGLHGGQIEAESAGEGLGATFRVRLPLAVDVGVAALRSTSPRERPPLPRLADVQVLVVDDEPGARDVLATLLGRCGARVWSASSVREALRDMENADVVVSDIAMAEEDGYALIRKLRATERARGRRIGAVAVTALASAEDRERALAEGFDVHLTKPVDPSELVEAVARTAARAG